jgi:hypothetical protein
MDPEVRLSDCGTHILIKPPEPITWRVIMEHLAAAIGLAHENDVQGFLIDVRGTQSMWSSFEHYSIAHHEGRRLGFTANSRVALLVSPGDRSRDFVETVAHNAGFNCIIFQDESAAKDWLEYKTP